MTEHDMYELEIHLAETPSDLLALTRAGISVSRSECDACGDALAWPRAVLISGPGTERYMCMTCLGLLKKLLI